MPPDNPPDRNDYMLKDGGVKVLLVKSKTAGRIDFAGVTINLDDPDVFCGSTANPVILNTPQGYQLT